jgi:tetratricopeptide (TPR) repeat protein
MNNNLSNIKGTYTQWKRLQQVHKLYTDRQWLECISLANELTSTQENDFFGFYYKGLCNTELKLLDEALNNFESALVNLRKNRFPWIMEEYLKETELRIAHVFRLQREYPMALERLNKLINQYPKYVFAFKSKAGVQVDIDELRNALETVNQGLSHNPNDTELQRLRNSLVYDLTTNQED